MANGTQWSTLAENSRSSIQLRNKGRRSTGQGETGPGEAVFCTLKMKMSRRSA